MEYINKILFSKSAPQPFKPLPPPLPARKPCTSACHPQPQSPFLSLLPAEVRNVIYQYVFTPSTSEQTDLYPLAMLLTCHKINHEAATLAFHHHTFALARHDRQILFVAMRNSISHLSTYQIHAITALSYDLQRKYIDKNASVAPIICNAILLFPSLARFEIRIQRGRKPANDTHHSQWVNGWYREVLRSAVEKYAPYWFNYQILKRIMGHAYAWQTGEHWEIQWPQLMDDGYFHVLDDFDAEGNQFFTPFMGTDAVGNVRGVHPCPCLCGDVSWTSADLVQETGRKVAIDTVFYGPEDKPLSETDKEILLRAKKGFNAVILKPGVRPLPVVEACGKLGSVDVMSVSYDAHEEYWEAVRQNNWDAGALYRGWWKAVTQKPGLEKFPGSRSLGQGDWARMNEIAEANQEGTGF